MMKLAKPVLASIAAVAIAATSFSGALAANADNANAATLAGKADCGSTNTNFSAIGFVNYHRVGDTLSLNYHLQGALPNATYTVQMWGPPCNFLATLGTVKTNSNGVGNADFSMPIPFGRTQFFATSYESSPAFGPYNDTVSITLS
jgi:hypothetical protein